MAISTTTGRASRQKIQQHLQNVRLKALFVEELGWDILTEPAVTITIDSTVYVLRPLAAKRGVKVLVCDPDASGQIPADHLLRRIEHEATRLAAYELFIIYVDAARKHQVWQWVKRERGQRMAARINRYHQGQSGELLAQKLERLAVRLEEEEHLHMTDVLGRVAQAFDVERVTRKFYERFKREHTAFLELIEGLKERADREWYASLMLNRLMFVYFIQRKGFLDIKEPGTLDGDPHYLSNRLAHARQKYNPDQSHTFYRHFLLKLFHEGLGQRHHAPELEALLGRVPYLNGGLFDTHVLEQMHPEINIPDQAFVRLFAFFDEFDWHLDDRPLRNDREMNPDVLGFIFEKYTNQKQMGAYYTKEDITEYIGTHTILPFILDAAAQQRPSAFSPAGPVWVLLRENPDAYIYDAVKKGCELPLPAEIAAGMQDVARRGAWDRPAPEAYALPTETWREVVARRTHYQEVRARLVAEQITSVNDLITYNLDIHHFTEDVIAYCTSTDVLRALYDSIARVTVLDPTCGSGAFLFAALNILEGIYAACLERMQDLLEERASLDATLPAEGWDRQADMQHFRAILEQVGKHAQSTSFIYTSIIVNNLYGVDIMKEATETCKLRLFLKLASQVETSHDIKPLPDIDFNIRAGNTLVGFASLQETQQAIEGRTVGKGGAAGEIATQQRMIFDDRLERIEQQAREAEHTFEHFHALQTQPAPDFADLAASKQRLRQTLGRLRATLDSYLASASGSENDDQAAYDARFAQWQQSHQPFHWWVEFYGIMQRGGFDVIIGNPPYVAYSTVTQLYQVPSYHTYACKNLYAYTMERSLSLARQGGRFGMIVPVSAVSGEQYQALNALFRPHARWISTYSNRPGKLFAGVEQRLAIFLVQLASQPAVWTSPYQHWYESERERLFSTLIYCQASTWATTGMPIKSGHPVVESIFSRLTRHKALSTMLPRAGNAGVWVHDGPTYWVRALPFEPNLSIQSSRSHHYHCIPASTPAEAAMLSALLSSSTFYVFYKMVSNCRDLGPREWLHMPFDRPQPNIERLLARAGCALAERLRATASRRTRHYASGSVAYEEYYPARARDILDAIDRILASHYGFTDQELDFIIHYDSKYRLGRERGTEEEE